MTTHTNDRTQSSLVEQQRIINEEDSDDEDEVGGNVANKTTPVQVMVVQRQQEEISCSEAVACWRVIWWIICVIGVIIITCSTGGSKSRSTTTQYYSPSSGSSSSSSNYDTFGRPYSNNYGSSFLDSSSSAELKAGCKGVVCKESAKEIISYLNASVDPCEDFHKFACQGWQNKNPRPEYLSDWSAFSKLEMESVDMVIEILNEPVNKANDIQALVQAKKYFKNCMNVDQYANEFGQDNRTIQLMLDTLEKYGGWPILYEEEEHWDSSKFSLLKSVAGLRREFYSSNILDVKIFQGSDMDISRNTIILRRPTASSSEDESFVTVPTELTGALKDLMTYKDFIVNISRELLHFKGVTNVNETKLEMQAFTILWVQAQLHTADEKQNIRRISGYAENVAKITLDKLQILMERNLIYYKNELDLRKLLTFMFADTNVYISRSEKLLIGNLDYLLGVSRFLSEIKPVAIANYLHFQMVYKMIPMIPSSKLQGYLDTLKDSLLGTAQKTPISQVCAAAVQKKFAYALGQKYVFRKYPNIYTSTSNKDFEQVEQLFNNIKLSLKSMVTSSSQIDYIDREKLKLILTVTDFCPGAPTWIYQRNKVQMEYAGLHLKDSSFLEQTMAINNWMVIKRLKALRERADSDPCQWTRFVGTVGPYNRILTVYVPLGILKAPFFNLNLPKSLIYGKLGSILGHELTHGMVGDSDGWTTDKNGEKTKLSKCFIDYYSNFTFEELNDENSTLDGVTTLEENISDNAGILAAYNAFKKDSSLGPVVKMEGLEKYTDEQLFYIGFAQNWCKSSTLQSMQSSLSGDEHSPARFRVLGTLQNSKEFAQAWKCSIGSKMNPGQTKKPRRCKLF